MAHAKLSPSARHRWSLCPGSVREEAKYPESSGAAAVDGTHSHTLLEQCLTNGLIDPFSMVGQTLTDHEGEFTVDHERAGRVKLAVDYIKNRMIELRASHGDVELYSEEQVDPAKLVGRSDMSGTLDCRIMAPGYVEIIDYKDGVGKVDLSGDGRLQLEQYAIGVMAEGGIDLNTTVQMTVVQPKLSFTGGQPVSSVSINGLTLMAAVDTIKAQAAATDAGNAPLVPGDTQCKWCRAKGSCAALANHVLAKADIAFPVVELPVGDLVDQSAGKDPAVMTVEQLQQILEAAPLMRQMIEAAETEALRRMSSGIPVPGFKIVHGRGSRAWNCDDDEMEAKLKRFGIPASALWTKKLVSPAQVEKLRWSKRDGTVKQLTDRQIEQLNNDLVSRLAGKPTVVPESDSRAAIQTTATHLFSSVEPAAEPVLPAWLV